jgi:pyrophosphatase PpaX
VFLFAFLEDGVKLKCVVFDMDGTLAQTNQLIYDSFNYIAEKYEGRKFAIPEIVALFGPPEEVCMQNMVGKDRCGAAMKDYLQFYRANHNRLATLVPGIEDVLKFIKSRGVSLAVFTGKGTSTAEITLEEFGIRQYFDYVVSGTDVKNHKPSSEGLEKIIAHFGVQPEEVLMVGDHTSDVEAAHEAGANIAAVVWDSYVKEKIVQMETDAVFADVATFHRWLQQQLDEHCEAAGVKQEN